MKSLTKYLPLLAVVMMVGCADKHAGLNRSLATLEAMIETGDCTASDFLKIRTTILTEAKLAELSKDVYGRVEVLEIEMLDIISGLEIDTKTMTYTPEKTLTRVSLTGPWPTDPAESAARGVLVSCQILKGKLK